MILERFISPEGTFPVFGRSIPYRMATMQPLALIAWYNELPAGVSKAHGEMCADSVYETYVQVGQ